MDEINKSTLNKEERKFIRKLTSFEVIDFKNKFQEKYRIDLNNIFLDFPLQNFNEFNSKIDCHDIAKVLDCDELANIFVIWDLDDIDIIRVNNLIKIWDKVWYPSKDESIILYLEIENKLIMITHWNVIYSWSLVTDNPNSLY